MAKKKEKELAQCPVGEFCINETSNLDSNNLKRIILLSRSNSDLGLSKGEREKLYPRILQILDRLEKKSNTVNDMDDNIKRKYANIPKSEIKNRERFEILIILFTGLYNSKNKNDLIEQLATIFTLMNRKEIEGLVEAVKRELEITTEMDLNVHWRKKEFAELDEMVEELTEKENEELLSEADNTIPEEKQNFVIYEMETANINIPNFREKIIKHLKNFLDLIDFTQDQNELILSKSLAILDEFISRAANNDTSLPINVNLRLFAATIIYTAVISNEDMPRISMAQISEIANVNTNTLGLYYRKYFKSIYSKVEFILSEYKLGRIRNYISQYFFEILNGSEIETYDLVLHLKNNVLRRENLPEKLTQKNIDTLHEIGTQFQDKFEKFFSDLVEIVRNLIISSIAHKKIGALLSLNPLVKYLRERNINLLQKGKLYNSIKRILDFLEEKHPNFFPKRWGVRESLPEKEKTKRDREYRRIVGRKLKFYLLKKVYNGKYFRDGIVKCPECVKEGLNINTNSLKLKSLDCHHDSAEKENIFKSDNLYLLFNENRGNPNVLEYLINLLESENIILLCRNHHRRLHFNNEFDYIINFEDIFTFPSELIHILIKVSLDSFRLTKNLNPNEKGNKKKNIIRKIKKKYIIENFYGEYCHICGEFSIREDLSAFDFHHKYEDPNNIKAHELYDTLSCSEIVRILIDELGGYICTNCHTVIQYKLMHLLDDIYENKNIVKKIVEDYKFTQNKFTTMDEIKGVVIQDILEKSVMINETYERYLTAIYEISKIKSEITISDLVEYTGYDQGTIHRFFKKESDLLRQSIEIKIGGAPKPTIFILTEKGKEFISLIYHFKDYFSTI